jgi:hypothetical protein
MRSLLSPFHTLDRRSTVGVFTLALVAAAICWFLGTNVWYAILIGTAATVMGIIARVITAETEARALGWGTEVRTNRSGARDDVLNLSWSMRGRGGRVGRTAEIKLRQTARRRLAIEGLNLDRPEDRVAIEARIGAPAYQLLTREDITGVKLSTMTACLDLLDSLDANHYPAPQAQPRRRVLTFSSSRQKGTP